MRDHEQFRDQYPSSHHHPDSDAPTWPSTGPHRDPAAAGFAHPESSYPGPVYPGPDGPGWGPPPPYGYGPLPAPPWIAHRYIGATVAAGGSAVSVLAFLFLPYQVIFETLTAPEVIEYNTADDPAWNLVWVHTCHRGTGRSYRPIPSRRPQPPPIPYASGRSTGSGALRRL